MPANLLYTVTAAQPIPPVVEKTKGVVRPRLVQVGQPPPQSLCFSLPSLPSWLAVGLLSFHCCMPNPAFLIMHSIRGCVTSLLLLISSLSILGSVSPRPPSLAGKDRRLLLLSVKALHPDMAGMKTNLMVSSSGASWALVTGTVLKRNSHSLATLCVNAANTARGSLGAMEKSFLISSTHSAIFFSMDVFTKASSPIGVGFVTTIYTLLFIGEVAKVWA